MFVKSILAIMFLMYICFMGYMAYVSFPTWCAHPERPGNVHVQSFCKG